MTDDPKTLNAIARHICATVHDPAVAARMLRAVYGVEPMRVTDKVPDLARAIERVEQAINELACALDSCAGRECDEGTHYDCATTRAYDALFAALDRACHVAEALDSSTEWQPDTARLFVIRDFILPYYEDDFERCARSVGNVWADACPDHQDARWAAAAYLLASRCSCVEPEARHDARGCLRESALAALAFADEAKKAHAT